MRLLEANYGNVRVFSERPFGYKRYIVEWPDHTEMYSGIWYKKETILKKIEKRLKMIEENWTDNTEANESSTFLTQEEYDALKGGQE